MKGQRKRDAICYKSCLPLSKILSTKTTLAASRRMMDVVFATGGRCVGGLVQTLPVASVLAFVLAALPT